MICENDGYQTPGNEGSCPPALRNRYFRGKMLTVSDYEMEQRYLIQRRRLVNRAVLGWGVISGFEVSAEAGRITVGEGVGFDQRGRETVACETVTLGQIGDVVWLKPDCKVLGKDDMEKQKPAPGLYLLSVHYAECKADGVRIEDGCGESSSEWNHVRETVVYSLRQEPDERCEDGRPDCAEPQIRPIPEPATAASGDRGTHATLVEWSGAHLGKVGEPAHFDPCWKDVFCGDKCLSLDPAAGVPLACVRINFDECGDLGITELVDTVRVRRTLYPNDTLYDLIRGCDLTRIEKISWGDWHNLQEHVSRKAFRARFMEPVNQSPTEGEEEQRENDDFLLDSPPTPPAADRISDTTFAVRFSAPVQISSLTPDVVSMTLVRRDEDEAVFNTARVPIFWLEPEGVDESKTMAMGFRLQVSSEFWNGEIRRGAASGFERANQVEIRICCDSIIDWAGQAVDGNAIGRRLPSGNGAPGGDFVSRFIVDRKGTYPLEPAQPQPPADPGTKYSAT